MDTHTLEEDQLLLFVKEHDEDIQRALVFCLSRAAEEPQPPAFAPGVIFSMYCLIDHISPQ
jgi:hypothetical protein